MAGPFDSLSIATSALSAYRAGLDVTGHNIANINTPGYSRRTVVLAERPPVDPQSAGRGVDVLRIQANRNALIEVRIGHEQAALAHDGAILEGLSEVEATIGAPGNSIDADLQAFFDSFTQLSTDPTSASARDAVVNEGQNLSRAFNALSGRMTELQRSVDTSIRNDVTLLNDLASKIAQLNGQIMQNGADVDTLVDERSLALNKIAELADVAVVARADGAVDLSLSSGRALVVGATGYQIDVSSTPPSGAAALSLNGYAVTGEITSGHIGGLLQVRDVALAGYQTRLDQLAYDVSAHVNAIHSGGFDATGLPGGAFFTPLGAVTGAAASISVDPTLAGNSNLVAASATGAIGDNQVALALGNLRNARVMSGGTATATEAWANLVYEVGSDVASAREASGTRESVLRQLQGIRDQTSGVSLDEEAANMMKFQRSYEAAARFFTTVNSTLDTLLAMVR